jgi:hypothetical protein
MPIIAASYCKPGSTFDSDHPHLYHQATGLAISATLRASSKQTSLGNAYGAPGIIFADHDDVAPDVIRCATLWANRRTAMRGC